MKKQITTLLLTTAALLLSSCSQDAESMFPGPDAEREITLIIPQYPTGATVGAGLVSAQHAAGK